MTAGGMAQVFLRAERRQAIGWAIGLGAFVAMVGGIYASFDDPRQLDQLMENYPEELTEVFGGSEGIGTVSGFLRIELAGYMPVLLGVLGIMLVTKHLAGAEERGALDHLLARPVTRLQYYWGLLLAGLGVVALALAGAAAGGMLGFAFAGIGLEDHLGIAGMMLEFVPAAAIYLALGAFLGSAFHRRGLANAVGVAVVIAMMALEVVGRLVEGLDWVTYLTPHGYLGRSDLFHGEPDLGYLAYSAALATLLALAGARRFETKDLHG